MPGSPIRILAVVLAATPAAAAQDAESAAPAPISLHFSWPVPGHAVVTESVAKGGKTAHTRYQLHVAATDRTGELRIARRDLEFLEIDGMDATGPGMQKVLAPTIAMAQAMPDLVVSDAGDYLRIEAIDEVIDRAVAFVAAQDTNPSIDPEVLRRTLASPAGRALLAQGGLELWNPWVGAWAGLELTPGVSLTTAGELPTPAGNVPAQVTTTLALLDDGRVRLTSDVTLDSELAEAVLAGLLAKLASELARQAQRALPDLESAELSLRSHVEAVTDPRTLRPAFVITEQVIEVRPADQEPLRRIERHEYAFDWLAETSK